MNLSFYSNSIDRLHQENLRFLKAQQHRKPPKKSQAEMLSIQTVTRALEKRGFFVAPTTANAPFDAWVSETPTGPAFRLEIKGSLWKSQRYQAGIRNHSADVLIMDCINGSHHLFIIPMSAIAPRQNIAICQEDPAAYGGQWADYLNAWHHLDEAMKQAQPIPRQLALFGGD